MIAMPLPINRNQPLVMHVDLNSCFATIEQQANPLLRGKPIVVAAYNSPNGCVVAPSIEAKRYGIKTGMTVRDARLLYPGVVVRTPDPAKYRAVHLQFRKIFQDYSPAVSPKSIDEAVIDFTNTLRFITGRWEISVGKSNKDSGKRSVNGCGAALGLGRTAFWPSSQHPFRNLTGLLSLTTPRC
jgi:DNA polymerase-4